jgi:type IV pilus assembly protein PilA
MIVVALIGVLAAVAIPSFLRYQARSKTSEAKTNLASIRVAEDSYFAEHNIRFPAVAEPHLIPGPSKADFDAVGSDFATLGWAPEGRVYFSYAVLVSADATGFTADAGADTDGDGIVQLWGYAHPDGAGLLLNGAIGCDPAFLSPSQVGRCGVDESIF